MFNDTITTIDQLREVIAPPAEPALRKEIDHIDEHARDFIARSTFLLMGTSDAVGRCDVSPKGDIAGFVQVLDEHTLVIPDRPGNQRMDSYTNIIENPHVGLLLIMPGADWTLRVNGRATIVRDSAVLERCAVAGKTPALAIAVHVEELYLHCPKCFTRSKLWDGDSWVPHDEQPSFAKMSRDQAGYSAVPVEAVEKALEVANAKLY